MSDVVFSVKAVVLIVDGSVLMVVVVVVVVLVVMVVVVLVGPTEVVDVVGSRSEFGYSSVKIVSRTNPNIPSPRSVARTRTTELGLNVHLLCFRVDTCPCLDEWTGCR